MKKNRRKEVDNVKKKEKEKSWQKKKRFLPSTRFRAWRVYRARRTLFQSVRINVCSAVVIEI